MRLGIEQNRAQRHPDSEIDGANEGHVEREIDLRRGACEIDRQLGARDRDSDLDHEVLVARVQMVGIAIESALGFVRAIG